MQTSPESLLSPIPARRLGGAFLASLALHLLLVAALTLSFLQRETPADATLTRVALHATANAGSPATKPSMPGHRPATAIPAALPVATAAGTPQQPPPTAADTQDGATTAVTAATVVVAPMSSEDLRRRYLATLAPWLAQHVWYPPAARDAGLEGRVGLHLVVRRDGSVVALRVQRGSGSALLDAGALETVRRATPLPALPDALPDTTLELDLPIDFRLAAHSTPRP